MRVGLVIYGSLDTVSGGYLYDRQLVDYLRAQGDRVEVLSMPWEGYPRRLLHNFQRRWLDAQAALPVDVLLQDELNHPSLFLSNAALKRRASFPLVSIVHHLRANERHPRPLDAVYRRVERRYLQSMDGFIYNSQTTRTAVETLRGSPARCVVATPAGDRFLPALDQETILRRCQQAETLRLVYVGNVIERKGLHTVLKALESEPDGNWRLDVAGALDVEPGYARRLREQAQQFGRRVIFHGRAADEQARQLLIDGSVMVMPSFYEGFGIVYLEGMSFGLPALAGAAGTAGEIITEGVNGFLIAPEDHAAAARALHSLLHDRALLARMSLAARRRFDDFPTWEESTRRIREFLLEWVGTNDR